MRAYRVRPTNSYRTANVVYLLLSPFSITPCGSSVGPGLWITYERHHRECASTYKTQLRLPTHRLAVARGQVKSHPQRFMRRPASYVCDLFRASHLRPKIYRPRRGRMAALTWATVSELREFVVDAAARYRVPRTAAISVLPDQVLGSATRDATRRRE